MDTLYTRFINLHRDYSFYRVFHSNPDVCYLYLQHKRSDEAKAYPISLDTEGDRRALKNCTFMALFTMTLDLEIRPLRGRVADIDRAMSRGYLS